MPWITVVASLLIPALWIWRYFSRERYDPPLPPGSMGLPLVGETLHILYAMKTSTLWEFYGAREKKYGPIYKTHIFGHDRREPSSGIQAFKAKSFRHILLAFLGPDAIRRYAERASMIIQEHIDKFWMAGSEVKAYPLVKKALFSLVFSLFLSISDEEEERELLAPFQDFLQGLLELPIDLPGTMFRRAKVGRAKIFKKLDEYIAKRKVELETGQAWPQQDFLSVLLTTKGEDGEPMTEEEIKQNILMLVMSAHDTTVSSLMSSMKYIGENPWCYYRLRTEHISILLARSPNEPLTHSDLQKMDYTWKIVQEAMRLAPPAAGNLRRVITEFTMDGFTVPKDCHKKEKFFEEPERFKPDRFDRPLLPNTYVPFGGGPRICPGYELAKMQDRIFLHHLVTRFKWISYTFLSVQPSVVSAYAL
ncbi:cytochrome P450 716B1 [Selaginella moellendorffii]|uniref:cytochrome P450 716B1 n=1 Tax=Selaginella moellendorffii TaxID=88036 RepID=UPI000D1C89D7|nr:cytochrome P450 716B1 [Selaginella moellendorffii]|eukprot:XP_024538283.1 cytochrome P450 716B1 [Selaginella moellendorffii]